MFYLVIGAIVLIVIYVLVTYNGLVKITNRVVEAFSTMDVYLKKRWDLIPNVIESVKGYSKHEKETLKEIVKLRKANYDDLNSQSKLELNEKIDRDITKLMALAEAYPDLKASENFRDLSNQLVLIEDEIANSRKYYNASIRMLNDKVELFPSNIIAKLFGYKKMKMFEIQEEEKENVKVEL